MDRVLRGRIAAHCLRGGSDSGTTSIEGTWVGQYSLDGATTPTPVVAVIKDGGSAFFYDSNGFSFYLPPLMGTSLSGTLDAYAPYGYTFPNSAVHQQFTVAGTLDRSKIAGGFTGNGESGTFVLVPAPLYSGRPAIVAGTWDGFYVINASTAVNLVVQASGAFQGSDANGCSLQGTMTQVQAGENLYTVTVNSSGSSTSHGCGGDLTGLAYESDLDAQGFFGSQPGPYFHIGASNASSAFVAEFKVP